MDEQVIWFNVLGRDGQWVVGSATVIGIAAAREVWDTLEKGGWIEMKSARP